MHESVDAWIGEQVTAHKLSNKRVLEVGSRDLNGSVRHHFGGEYLGIDIVPGDGVDLVVDEDWPLRLAPTDQKYGVVVCSETLEHARRFWEIAQGCMDVLARDGWLLLTTRANGFPDHAVPHDEHGAGPDRWRFMPGALAELFTDLGLRNVDELPDPQAPGIFLKGRNP